MIKRYKGEIEPLILNGLEEIGNGCYATVYSAKKLDYVVKVGYKDSDPYWSYVKKVLKDKTNNPYFPKIRKAFTVYDKYYVVMERLKPIPYNVRRMDSWDSSTESLNNRAKLLAKRKLVSRKYGKGKLKEAIDLINSLGYCSDVHYNNIMLRGKQLVITDPVC